MKTGKNRQTGNQNPFNPQSSGQGSPYGNAGGTPFGGGMGNAGGAPFGGGSGGFGGGSFGGGMGNAGGTPFGGGSGKYNGQFGYNGMSPMNTRKRTRFSKLFLIVSLIVSAHRPTRTLRFVWCGSEERGLLGSKNYVYNLSKEELAKIKLNINVDVAGAVLGKDSAVVLAKESLIHMVNNLAKELAFPIDVSQDIYSSDCIPFADRGVPAINFMRFGVGNSAHIHDRYDTMYFISADALDKTYQFVKEFSLRLQNYKVFPIEKEIPENIVKRVDEYLFKKEDNKK